MVRSALVIIQEKLHRHLMPAKEIEKEKGQGMVEYALILVLIAVVVIVILSIIGKTVNDVFSNVVNGINQ